jgi:hypothetical protein
VADVERAALALLGGAEAGVPDCEQP